MYLEDIIDIELPKLTRNTTKNVEKTTTEKIRPVEKAISEKQNFMSNSIIWAGGATVLILAVNIYIAKN
jgi:hypothetical protein